jgi:amino acid adenylation domain-containing protein
LTVEGGRYTGHDHLGARGLSHTDDEFVAFAEAEAEQSVPEMFEKQADKFPDRIAVRTASREFTYDALNRTANRIAQAILAADAEGEHRVALLLEQSHPLLAASILGILKAGKIYVPIDPSYPPARTTYVLEDSQAALIVTGSANLSLAHELAGNERDVLDVDEIGPQLSDENPGPRAGPNSIAYIMYTSGSTGQPKGVVHTHRNLLRYIRNYTNSWRIRPSDRLTLFFSPSFSQSLMDTFSALLKGAALHPYDVKQEGLADLATWLIDEGITVFDSVPTLYRHFLDNLTEREEFPELRLIRLGGEPVTREIVARTRKHFPRRVLLNQLAATEASMIAQYPVDPETEIEGSTLPAGYPVDGVEVLLIDETGDEVGSGQVGEIVVKSRYLSSGYWRKPALTQAAFRADPHGGGKRLYHTGDLGRLRPDGCLEFLGRKDSRVKVRGHSIEVAEIEAALFDLGDAKEVAVTAQELGQDDTRLAAYVVPRRESLPSVSSMRAALAQTLPEFMIPSTFVSLPALPMTPNGKLDRRALPKPDEKRPDLESAYEAPRTQVEGVLASIWEEVLGLERVGVHDDFFELGGHSLLATRVMSRLRDAFGAELPLRSLFEAPTVAGLAGRIEAARRAEQNLSAPPLAPVPRDGQLPLSFAQQRMWLVDQLEPGAPTYNISEALRLTGRLDVTALERSLAELVRRHEALRTTFAVVEENPVQVIGAPTAVDAQLPVEDLSGLPQAEREAGALRRAREEAKRPFDLERGPLWKARLLRLDEEEHVLLLTKHHIVSDAWSMGLIRRELAALYEAFSNGRPSPLPELPIQYADYALWQRQWLTGEVLEEQIGYWKDQLAGVPTLQLPTDHPRPAVQIHRVAHRELELPEPLSEALRDLSRREGATQFMVLLAAFQALLARYSDQQDIAVGSPIAGRNRVETEDLIGYFVNNLVLRTDLSGDPTFKELLARVREVSLGAYANQDVPFEKLLEELKPRRDLSRNPLFQAFFNMVNVPSTPTKLSGLTVERLSNTDVAANFDVSLTVNDGSEGLKGRWEYNTDLFDDATIERMVGHFRTLLEGVVEDPDRHLSELPLLSEVERHKLLFEWNDTATEYPRQMCVHELFEEQVERTPGAVAVTFGDERLTYQELNQRANQLAHYLRGLRVGPEVLVGVCMRRSLEMVVGLLGILKAGGAYVPLDLDYPKERLAFMLDDSQTSVLLTQERLKEALPEHGARTVCLDEDWEEIAKERGENLDSGASSENLAYVIYTSGSTGRPKGVAVAHRGLTNYLSWCTRAYGVSESWGSAVHSPLGFDLTITSLFSPLLVGRRVSLVPEDEGIKGLRDTFLAGGGASLVKLTPSHLEMLGPLTDGEEVQGRARVLVVGGEELRAGTLSSWRAKSPGTAIFNEYGPTEAVVGCCLYEVPPEVTASGRVPIGRPVPNTRAYVLDERRKPVPIGVPGELYVGGAQVARGYLGRPALTAEKFLPDPFCREAGARMYRTGDLARWLPDGNLEYLGRTDNQVKIRGHRVEPGEVEAVLSEHPAVRESAVVAREDEPGSWRLVAYAVHGGGSAPSAGELRTFLREKLPEYMVPSAFSALDALPLTPNGKVDRRALPEPDKARPELGEGFVGPRSPEEEALAGIWEQVLGLERVGVNDDFFELGGHSLQATRVVSRVHDVFGVELPVLSIFEEPTLSGLADRLEEARQSRSAPSVAEPKIDDIEELRL